MCTLIDPTNGATDGTQQPNFAGDQMLFGFLVATNSGFNYSISAFDNLNFTVNQTTTLSAALPLFATSLGALGLLGWRRKRKTQAALAAS